MEANVTELMVFVRLLCQQDSVVKEIYDVNTLFDEQPYVDIDPKLFLKIYFDWKCNFNDMSELERLDQYKTELEYFKEQISYNLYELGKFSEKLIEHKRFIVRYHLAISRFNKLKHKIQALGLEKFEVALDLFHGNKKLIAN